MSLIVEKYNKIIKTIGDLNAQISNANNEIIALKKNQDTEIEAKIASLEDLLKKIDEVTLKVREFQHMVEGNLTSKNVLSIETPPGYRVDVNRLKRWAMLVDPTAKDDPYAQRIYVVAKCDEHFLQLKEKECRKELDELRETITSTNYAKVEQLEGRIQKLNAELEKFIQSESVWKLCQDIIEDNYKYWFENAPETFSGKGSEAAYFAPGAYAAPLPITEDNYKKLGRLYDAKLGETLIPVEISLEKEFVLTVSCVPSKDKQLDKGIRNLILNIIHNSEPGTQKVYVLDGVRFNTACLGSLKKLEDTFALAKVPRNQDQLTETLENIVASFADIDEKIEDCDSVKEYNSMVSPDKRIPLTTIILYGWPKAYEGRNKELMNRIMSNYERYGVSFVTVTYKKSEPLGKEIEDNFIPEYATHNAVHIRMFPNDTTIAKPDEAPQKFTWYVFEKEISDEYAESLKAFTIEKNVIGNEYIKRYPLDIIPAYNLEKRKSIVLPFGITAKDEDSSLSFDNENFAAYLMGASGSGKSTLLHTLITGIIRNYHPDDVELWLADFKMAEFSQYINPMPPHIKYILLDESQELVFDLIDKLTEKMMERQRFMMINKNREGVVENAYMPVIFVILDEFSIMSQVVAQSDPYKLKLQNLLAKGRALGIKFIFASQTFSSGVVGLTSTAKKQIQLRLAMKNSYEEINETLELSPITRTDQVRAMMDSLPPYYVLVKRREGEKGEFVVRKYKGMYFAGKDAEAYEPQRQLIKNINANLKPVAEYDPNNNGIYVDKKPVVVDGNAFYLFVESDFLNEVAAFKNNIPSTEAENDLYLSFGTPRLMAKTRFSLLSSETRENLLLISSATEQACSASILISAMKCVKAQNGNVQIWAYSKNRLFKAYKNTFVENGFEIVEGMENICNAISKTKQDIINKIQSNTLIVLIGMDRICMDFGYIEGNAPEDSKTISGVSQSLVESGAVVSSEDDKKLQQFGQEWFKFKKQFKEEAKAAGKTEEEIKELLKEILSKKRSEQAIPIVKTTPKEKNISQEELAVSKENGKVAYNASKDFEYIIKQGSKLGYHFFLNISSLLDLKETGLKKEYFRHKLSFQISAGESRDLFNNKVASTLPEHICQYDDSLDKFSFRPYLHKNVVWEGWNIDADGKVISPYREVEN